MPRVRTLAAPAPRTPAVRPPAARALLALALAAVSGCGGSPTQPGGTGGGSGAIRIVVRPALDTLRSFHERVIMEAGEVDPQGNQTQPKSVAWRSTDTSVVTVSPDGRLKAYVDSRERNATARVIASTGGGALADTAVIVVRQAPASVSLSPDSGRAFGAGDTVRFRAATVDGNGYPLAGYDVPLDWRVTDSAVAGVDADGLVTARGLGWSELLASDTAVGDSARALVWVYSPRPPVLDSIAPSSLTEAGVADLYGSDLGIDPHANTVIVDGRAAVVLHADTTHVAIRVPDEACLPPHPTTLRLATPAGSTSTSVGLVPEEAPVSLTVGRQRVARGPASEVCLQFPASSSSERYLVGVQSRDRTAGSVLSVDVVSRTPGDTAPAASLPPVSLALRAVSGARIVSGVGAPSPGARWAAAEARLRRWQRERLRGLPALAATGGAATGAVSAAAAASLPGSLAQGDTVRLRVPDLTGTDLCQDYTEITGVVRAVGERVYVISDRDDPDGGFTQADYQAFGASLDSVITPALYGYFGAPTDIDGNGRVAAVFTSRVNQADPDLLGFEFAGDLYDRSLCPSSDEGEVFYANVPDPMGQYGPVYGRDSAVVRAPWVMAHELTHVIQQSRRVAAGLPFMGSVMAEAQATLGEEVAGNAATGRTEGGDYGYDVAFATSAADTVAWYADAFTDLFDYFGFESATSRVAAAPRACGWWAADPSPCTGRSLWYGVGWSFLRWVADRYGASYAGGASGLARALIADPETGPAEVANLVGASLDDLLARWSASLWLDGRGIPGLDPALALPSWDLYDIQQGAPATARLSPAVEGWGDWHGQADVKAGSAGYLILDGGPRPATALGAFTSSAGDISGRVQLWVVRVQ